ncbi:predicted protein [Postia placenta Mad-698-R]|nr:predicted protein [Postia placenta Mad-698-R]
MPHKYRHVLGWYRIVKELRECDVHAICVFDGTQRSVAKEAEAKRRKSVRRTAAARSALETDRLKRLRKLGTLVQKLRGLKDSERQRLADILRTLVGTLADGQSDMRVLSGIISREVDSDARSSALLEKISQHTFLTHELLGAFKEPNTAEILFNDFKQPSATTGFDATLADSSHDDLSIVADEGEGMAEEESMDEEDADEGEAEAEDAIDQEDANHLRLENLSLEDRSPIKEPSEVIDVRLAEIDSPSTVRETVTSTQDLSSALSSLYLEYRSSIPQLTTLPQQSEATSAQSEAAQTQARLNVTKKLDDAQTQLKTAAISSEVLTPERLAPSVTTLPQQSEATFAQSEAISSEVLTPERLAPSEETIVQLEEQANLAMSKTQLQLTLDEGSFWGHLSQATANVDETEIVEAAAAALAQKSSALSESYERRTHPPTAETYAESKEILSAMGIPCLDSTGPFEAEALASALVLNGYADYVASEDTDVLVYDAPLIRNITNRKGPLVVISGTDVREHLRLDRSSFVDFALMLGTDFSQRIKNVGPARALKFIREYGSIERVIECERQYPPRIPPKKYLAQVSLARMVFSTLPPTPDVELLRPGAYNEEEVTRLLALRGLERAADEEWDPTATLSGNFFDDNPTAL